MTLYEFNILSDDDKLKTVWVKGVFLDNYVTKSEKKSCYAIDMFFVELEYDLKSISMIKINSFKTRHYLNE
jgi:hypothetical protein